MNFVQKKHQKDKNVVKVWNFIPMESLRTHNSEYVYKMGLTDIFDHITATIFKKRFPKLGSPDYILNSAVFKFEGL